MLRSLHMACGTLLATALAHGQAPEITRYGAQVAPLVEYFIPSHAHDSPNGWPELLRVVNRAADILGQHSALPDQGRWLSDSVKPDRGLDPECLARIMVLLKELEEAEVFESLEALADFKRFVRPAQAGNLLEWEYPYNGPARMLANAAVLRMRLAFERGDSAAAISSFRGTLALARGIAQQSTLIDRLVAILMLDSATAELRFHLVERRLDSAALDKLAEMLEQPLPPIALMLQGERLIALDTLRRVYESPDPYAELDQIGSSSEPGEARRLLADFGLATQTEANAFVERVFERLLSASSEPGHKLIETCGELAGEVDELPPKHSVAKIILPTWRQMGHAMTQSECLLAGTRCMLAIERFRAARGALPDHLETLVPEYVVSLPDDPYCGGGFVYKLEPESPTGYVLYSVGWDGRDDGGKPHADRKAAFGTRPGDNGHDFVFTAGRARVGNSGP